MSGFPKRQAIGATVAPRHEFGSTSWTVPASGWYMIVLNGGGGGGGGGGTPSTAIAQLGGQGGQAGNWLLHIEYLFAGDTVTLTAGAGGAGGAGGAAGGHNGGNGGGGGQTILTVGPLSNVTLIVDGGNGGAGGLASSTAQISPTNAPGAYPGFTGPGPSPLAGTQSSYGVPGGAGIPSTGAFSQVLGQSLSAGLFGSTGGSAGGPATATNGGAGGTYLTGQPNPYVHPGGASGGSATVNGTAGANAAILTQGPGCGGCGGGAGATAAGVGGNGGNGAGGGAAIFPIANLPGIT